MKIEAFTIRNYRSIKELKINNENVSSIADTDNNVLHVAKNGSDIYGNGSLGNPYLTINKANNYFIANKSAWPIRMVIKVAPGIYNEQIEDAFYRIYIVGPTTNPDDKNRSVTIRNTGADEDHYVISPTITTGLNLIGITIETSDAESEPLAGIYGKLLRTSTFSYCKMLLLVYICHLIFVLLVVMHLN